MTTLETAGPLLLNVLLGGVLGAVFFSGLWWTVKRLPRARHPALLALGSLAVRTLLVVLGLYWLMDSEVLRLAAALLGFMGARWVLIRHIRTETLL